MFDFDDYSPQLQTAVIVILLVVSIFLLTRRYLPTAQGDTATVKHATFKGVVSSKDLSVRGYYDLEITSKERVVKTPDLRFFYDKLFLHEKNALYPYDYEQAQRASLPVYAAIGDSLIKASGELVIRVKHGNIIHLFLYSSPYQ